MDFEGDTSIPSTTKIKPVYLITELKKINDLKKKILKLLETEKYNTLNERC